MKTLALFIGLLLLLSLNAKGAYQNITNDLVVGNRVAASSSAVLQVESTTKGFLPPRMTSSQRDAIASPVEGLTIFNTTLNSIQVYAGGVWGNVGGGGSDHPIWTSSTSYGIGTIVIDSTDSNWKVYRANTAHTSTSSVFGDDFALSYWDELANNIDNITSSASSSVAVWDGTSGDALGQTPVFIDSSGNITGVNTIDMASTLVASGSVTSTGLEVISTTEGSIPCPKMTEAERDLIGAPVVGNCVFNTTTNKLNIYDGVDWVSAGGGLSKWAASTSYKQYDVVWNDSDNKIYFAIADFTSAGSFVGANWTELSNDVNASGTVVDNAITRWNGTTGDSIQSSLVSIDDSGNIDTPTGLTSSSLTATGSVAFGTLGDAGFSYNGSTLSLASSGAATLLNLNQSGSGTALNIDNNGSGNLLLIDTNKLIVQNNGEIGAGITDPTSTLHVVGDLQIDNLNFNANSLISTDTNGNITLSPNGSGEVGVTSPILLTDVGATPSTPSSGFNKIYCKTGTSCYRLTSGGVELALSGTSPEFSYVSYATDTALIASDSIVAVDASSEEVGISLPSAVSYAGKVYWVSKTDSSSNNVRIIADGSETINGFSSSTVVAQYDSLGLYSDGANWLTLTNKRPSTVYLLDVKTSGVAGGASSNNTVHTRDLNTLIGDNGFISLSSNQITLQAGKYEIEANAPAYQTNEQKLFFYNVTASSYVTNAIEGLTEYWASGGSQGRASLSGTITITSPTTYELRHWIAVGSANGLGQPSSGTGNPQANETYSQVKITRAE